ncbi:hypothetical protein, partial [Salegentibacter mishustinae]|uniref:hypothetical protein n=1 Tax=Salegentibacter mishustinae TaxID=270918 RepID=UPI002490B2AF
LAVPPKISPGSSKEDHSLPAIVYNVSYKNCAAGEADCPQDDQAWQANTEFRFETKISIVFIFCCEASLFPQAKTSKFTKKSTACVVTAFE